MKHPRIQLVVFACLALLLLSSLAFAERSTDSQTITTSGTSTNKISNTTGGMNASFEELTSGSPATVSIVIRGCKSGGTCDILDTNTSTAAAQIRTPTIGTAYDYFTVTPSWTGGTNVSVQINTTLSTARNGTGGGPPNGAAGGSLAGTYPNPSVASSAVGNSNLATGAVTDDKASLEDKPSVGLIAVTNLALSGAQTIDGVAGTAGQTLVLATAQTTGSQNGPWVMQSGAWTRPAWYPSGGTTQAVQFATIFVRLGTAYQGSTWRLTTPAPVTIDTTSTTWLQTALVLGSTSVAGTLPSASLPNPSASTLGGIQSLSVVSHQFLTGISNLGVPSQAQPAASDVSGLAPSATTDTTNASNISSGTVNALRLPAALANSTSVNGTSVPSSVNWPATLAAVSHKFLTSFTQSTGLFVQAQPACADLSDSVASCNTDATNASNISSGTLNNARIPWASPGTIGSTAPAPASFTFIDGLVCFADLQVASSPAAKMAACAAALTSGGTIDARGFPCYTGSNAQTWDQTVELGFTGAGGVNGKAHTLLMNSCTQWNITITDKQSVPLVIHPQSNVIDDREGTNSGNGMVVASSANFPELIAANCDVCWLKISAISRSGTTVTVTTSTSGPTLSSQPLQIYGVTDSANFANGTYTASGSGTSYTYTQAGSAVSSSGGAAGFGYTGFHGTVTIVGLNDAIGSSPTMLHGLHLYAPLQGTMVRGINLGCPANGEGFLLDGFGTSVGPVEILNDTVDCASSTASLPLVINTAGTGGQLGSVNVRGGLYAHGGTGKALITISDTGGNHQNQGVNLYGPGVEDNNSTAIGVLINGADNVNVHDLSCGSASGNGAHCVSITGSNMTNINIWSPEQNSYTDNISDTSNSHSVTLPQNRISYYGYGTGSNPACEWSWHTNGSSGDKVICLDNSGVGMKNIQQQTGGNFTKGTASLGTWESIPIYANQIISFSCQGRWQGSTTAVNLGLAVTTPTSPTNIGAWAQIYSTATTTYTQSEITATATPFTGAVANAANTSYPFYIFGTVENGANAGTLAIQAQNTAASGTMSIMRGSYCRFDHQ